MIKEEILEVINKYKIIMKTIEQKEEEDFNYVVIFDDDKPFIDTIFNLNRQVSALQEKITESKLMVEANTITSKELNMKFEEMQEEISDMVWGIRKRDKIEAGWFDDDMDW